MNGCLPKSGGFTFKTKSKIRQGQISKSNRDNYKK